MILEAGWLRRGGGLLCRSIFDLRPEDVSCSFVEDDEQVLGRGGPDEDSVHVSEDSASESDRNHVEDPLLSYEYDTTDQGSTDGDPLETGVYHCNTCVVEFDCREELSGHLKADLHVYNLRLRMLSDNRFQYKPVSEEEFEELFEIAEGESSGEDAVSKRISKGRAMDLLASSLERLGSDAKLNRQDPGGRKKSKRSPSRFIAFNFKDTLPDGGESLGLGGELSKFRLLVYADLLLERDEDQECVKSATLVNRLSNLVSSGCSSSERQGNSESQHLWLIVLYRAGYFAASTIDARTGTINTSKSVQRYTVRRKQGGSQIGQDKKQAWANSAGAQLRRHNEQLLRNDISDIFDSIKIYIGNCSYIFISCPPTLRKEILYKKEGDPGYLLANDKRIRFIPFTTHRPTTKEILRCYKELTRAQISPLSKPKRIYRTNDEIPEVGLDDLRTALLNTASSTTSSKYSQESDKEKGRAGGNSIAMKAIKYVSRDKLSLLRKIIDLKLQRSEIASLLNEDDCDLENNGLASVVYKNLGSVTLLHLASGKGSVKCVTFLLHNGSNPAAKDASGRTPFEVSKNRETRNVFMATRRDFSDMWDWDAARVPSVPMRSNETPVTSQHASKVPKHRHSTKKHRPKKQESPDKPTGDEAAEPAGSEIAESVSTSAPVSETSPLRASAMAESPPRGRRTLSSPLAGPSTLDSLNEQQTKEYLRRKAYLSAMKRLGG